MALTKLLLDRWGEGVLILKVVHEVGELATFHAVMAPIEAIVGGREGI